MNEQTDTPETAELLTKIFDDDGELCERNAPEKWVTFARNLERERNELRRKSEAQKERIRYLEGATNHATGTPLSIAIKERNELRAEVEKLKDERENWRVSSVCRELRAELETLKADKTRLDWLMNGGLYQLPNDNHGMGDEYELSREAIDSAMKGDA